MDASGAAGAARGVAEPSGDGTRPSVRFRFRVELAAPEPLPDRLVFRVGRRRRGDEHGLETLVVVGPHAALGPRLDGDAVEAVVSDFYDRVFDDPLLEPYFEGVDREALYAHQVQFVSAVAGGPVSYEGADMREAHEGMGITAEAFGRVATYLGEALRENGVAEADVETILDEVGALEPDVVGR